MKRNHKHADMIRRWLDDDSLEVEMECHGSWLPAPSPCWYEDDEYRFKPRIIRIGEFDVPEPMRVLPEDGTEYWSADLHNTDGDLCFKWRWVSTPKSSEWFKRGLCHTTAEAAELHARALISLTEIINTEGN